MIDHQEVAMTSVIPVFRIFDEQLAKSFYVDFLGFNVDWEHRFEEDLPLYMQVSYDQCIIHLTEHFGDCSPGGYIRIAMDNIKDFHANLSEQKYKYARPGLETGFGNNLEVRLGDPFGNKLVFFEKSL